MKITKSQIESIVYEIRAQRKKESDAEHKAFTQSKEVDAAVKKVFAAIQKLPKWWLDSAWTEDKQLQGLKKKYIDYNFKSKLKPLKGYDALYHHINIVAAECETLSEVIEKINPYA